MKKTLIISLLFISLFSANLFPAFELSFIPKFAMQFNLPVVNSSSYRLINYVSFEPKLDINLQLGYKFKINNDVLNGISLLFDTGFDGTFISIKNPYNYQVNKIDVFGFYTGIGLKFEFNAFQSYLALPANMALGIAAGAKYGAFTGNDLNLSRIPISVYTRLTFEDRFYQTEKYAFLVSVDLFYEYMFFNKNDVNKLFYMYDVKDYHSVGAAIGVGMLFGNK